MYVPILALSAIVVAGPLLGTLLGYGLSTAAISRVSRKDERKTLVQLAIELACHKNALLSYLHSLLSAREKIMGGYGVMDLDQDQRRRLFIEHFMRNPFPAIKNGILGINLRYLQDTLSEEVLWKMERYEGLLEFLPTMHVGIADAFLREKTKSSFGIIAATQLDGLLRECSQFMASIEDMSRLAVDLVNGLHVEEFVGHA